MTELFSSGRIIDAILLMMVLQGLVLLGLYRRSGKGVHPLDYFFNALPGAFLMLALRNALVDAEWQWIAICLIAALITHWLELWRLSRDEKPAAKQWQPLNQRRSRTRLSR